MAARETIYSEAGGAPGIEAAVSVLYNRVLADAELAPYFAGIDLGRLAAHQRAFLAVAFGGPDSYVGRSLEDAHRGLGITDAHFDRLADHLDAALRDLGLADPARVVVRARIGELRPAIVP